MNRTEKDANESRKNIEEESVKYIDALYRNALGLARNAAEAEDLVQDTFEKALRYYDTFQEGTNLKAWLLKIQFNTFIRRYNKAALEMQVLRKIAHGTEGCQNQVDNSLDAVSEAERCALWPIIRKEIGEAVRELPDDYRLMITLVDVEELKYREVAEVIGVPVGTVMSRIHRARKLLREILSRRAERNPGFAKDNAGRFSERLSPIAGIA